jgi:hypothetical protein
MTCRSVNARSNSIARHSCVKSTMIFSTCIGRPLANESCWVQTGNSSMLPSAGRPAQDANAGRAARR